MSDFAEKLSRIIAEEKAKLAQERREGEQKAEQEKSERAQLRQRSVQIIHTIVKPILQPFSKLINGSVADDISNEGCHIVCSGKNGSKPTQIVVTVQALGPGKVTMNAQYKWFDTSTKQWASPYPKEYKSGADSNDRLREWIEKTIEEYTRQIVRDS